MNFSRYLLVATLMLLAACTGSHRPVYSGHQESTEGVPGFANGKKTSPYVKLGQSYSVDGEEYVPRHQPDYVEEGNASWYGPGFHGGKTANGEVFDANELTGAHRTLPLPSIVRVTMISTGKQVYIRINDRGPFAHSRILDMSRAAANKIGLLRAGVAKVRVEYMPKETERLTDLMAQGRDPKSIDLASEIIDYSGSSNPQYARADTRMNIASVAENASDNSSSSSSGSFWDNFGSSPSNTAEPTPEAAIEAVKTPIPTETMEAAPVSDVVSSDLPAPKAAPVAAPKRAVAAKAAPSPAPVAENGNSPFAVLDSSAGEPAAKPIVTASVAPQAVPAAAGNSFVQLGAFSNQDNAQRLVTKYKDIAPLQIVQKTNASGQSLFHVRAGPYTTTDASMAMRDQLAAAGADAKITRE